MIPLNGYYEILGNDTTLTGDNTIPSGTTAICVSSGNNASHCHIKLGRILPGDVIITYQEVCLIAGIPFNVPKTTTHYTTTSVNGGGATFITFLKLQPNPSFS